VPVGAGSFDLLPHLGDAVLCWSRGLVLSMEQRDELLGLRQQGGVGGEPRVRSGDRTR
jgi:hypothetical protein